MNIHLNNEGQECKTAPVRGKVLVGRGGGIERVEEDEYGQCTLYTCMTIEH
jgi:hypothetical protein